MANNIKASSTSGIDHTSRTEHLRGSNPSSYSQDGGSDQSGSKDMMQKASDAGDKIAEKAKATGQSIMDTGEGFADRAKDAHSSVCKFTKDNPTASVLIAFGAGAVLARLLPKW